MVLFINLVFKRVIVLEILSCEAVVHASADDGYVDRLTNPFNFTNYVRSSSEVSFCLISFSASQSSLVM